MKVKLLQMTETPIDIMWTAARTCYSEKSPINMWEERCPNILREVEEYAEKTWKVREEKQEKMWNLVSKVLDSGHESIAEFVNFTFAIEGVSRVLLAQITRHRTGVVFCVQSQRYVEFKESYETLTEAFDGNVAEQEDYLKTIAEKYFTHVTTDNYRDYVQALINYLGAVKRGVKPEDARNILPNATKTNITMGINLRELMHVCNLRMCNNAQTEIRQLFNLIKKEVETRDERLASLLMPKCEKLGYCDEHKSCGRKPSKNDVVEYYKGEYIDGI